MATTCCAKGGLAIAGEPRRLIVQGCTGWRGFDYGLLGMRVPCSRLVVIRSLPAPGRCWKRVRLARGLREK